MKKKTGLGICLGFAWALAVSAAPTHLVDEKPVRISQPELGDDKEIRDQIAAMRDDLLKPRVGRWGQLQEWEEDKDDPEDNHRHVSQMFALHPGRQISMALTPELAEAARVSLDARGDESTGWSGAWKINFWARLGA